MNKISGSLIVANKDWRHVYRSVLNFFNDEIKTAYDVALDFYEKNQNQPFHLIQEAFNAMHNKNNTYRYSLIRSALFSGTNQRMYKPKKNNFRLLTNRTHYIDTEQFNIGFNKIDNSINFTTCSFENLDDFLASHRFISEFITMVNTIDWPTRFGPKRTTRGCILVCIKNKDEGEIFYKVGPNPPITRIPFKDVTLPEPIALQSDLIKNISFVSNSTSETSQPLPLVPNSSDF